MLIRLAVLFSGNGSNLQSILEKLHKKTIGENSFEVALCISNNKSAYGIQRAKNFGLNTTIIDHKDYTNKKDFDKALVKEIEKHKIDLCVLAGFMRILGTNFTKNIKAINLHPSLLPLFKGANAIKESYESDMKVAGVSVHIVNDILDGGQIIAQKAFDKNDLNYEEFEAKIHEIEHDLLPQAIIDYFKLSKSINTF